MKFKKILAVGIPKDGLDSKYWSEINNLSDKLVLLSEDSLSLKNHLRDVECLLVRFNKADKEMLDQSPNLKYIGALATGFGKIDINYARSKGIVVTNVPGYSTESVAEFVFAVLLEKLRDIERARSQSKEGNRSEVGFSATEIKGKTFGVLGFGKIGQRVGQIAASFGAKVLYWSKHRKKEFENENIKFLAIDQLIPQCDFLSFHFALTSETVNIVNAKRVAKIKKGAIVVNTAPMELIDMNALEKRLKKDDLTFIFDHWDEISKKDLKRLEKYKNCIIYPAIAYVSNEARVAKQDIFVENMGSFLKGQPQNVVN